MALAGAAVAIDMRSVTSAFAQGSRSSVDLVAVMGGEPAPMLNRMLAEYGGIETFVKKGAKVVLKPNIGWDKTPELGANTNPEVVGEMVKLCMAAGAAEVQVFDNTCDNWQRCYASSGIEAAVKAAGGKMVPAADKSYYVEVPLPGGEKLKNARIHQSILDCDVWFNIPVMKHHSGAKMSIAMKNYMGIVYDRQIFHSTDLQQCIADVATYDKKPALHIVDAYRVMVQNGPRGKSENDVVLLKSLLASADPVAVDTASVKMFAQAKPMILANVSHIGKGEALGLGTTNIDTLNVKRIRM